LVLYKHSFSYVGRPYGLVRVGGGGLGTLENLNTALDDVQTVAVVALAVLEDVHGGIALNVDHSTLGQTKQVVARGAFAEAGNAEPAGLTVVPGPAVAGDGIAHELAAGAGLVQLGGVGEVANDGHPGDGPGGGGAERASSAGRDGGRAAEEHRGRHVGSGWMVVWLMQRILSRKGM
jgi:hypothetical protein